MWPQRLGETWSSSMIDDRACLFKLLDGPPDVGGISMTIVAVGKQRQIHRVGKPPHGVCHLRERQQFNIWRAEQGCRVGVAAAT